MNPVLLLFDIDGTLLRSNGVGGRAWRSAGRRAFGEGYRLDGLSFAGQLDRAMYRKAAELNRVDDHEERFDEFHAAYLDELGSVLEEDDHGLAPMAGAVSLLAHLSDRSDLLMGLLTGNGREGAGVKLRAGGIDPGLFKINAFGDEAEVRDQLTDLAMQRYAAHVGRAADPRRVAVIGDTVHDVACAKAHDCISFGVATGPATADDLQAAGADVVMPDLKDPEPLLRWVAAAGR